MKPIDTQIDRYFHSLTPILLYWQSSGKSVSYNGKTLASNGKPLTSRSLSNKSSKAVTSSPATIQAQAAAAAMIQPYINARLQSSLQSAACMNVNPYLRYNPAFAAAAAAINPYATAAAAAAGYPPPSVNSVSLNISVPF